MDIESLTLKQLREISSLIGCANVNSNGHSFTVGTAYLIRTVTHITIGIMKSVEDKELVLSDASWIADTGRFHDALKNGKLNEVEPYINDVIVGRGSIVDATVWNHPLPREQK